MYAKIDAGRKLIGVQTPERGYSAAFPFPLTVVSDDGYVLVCSDSSGKPMKFDRHSGQSLESANRFILELGLPTVEFLPFYPESIVTDLLLRGYNIQMSVTNRMFIDLGFLNKTFSSLPPDKQEPDTLVYVLKNETTDLVFSLFLLNEERLWEIKDGRADSNFFHYADAVIDNSESLTAMTRLYSNNILRSPINNE